MRIIGIDTGGTFTDLIVQDGDALRVHKLLSTPANPAEAVLAGLTELDNAAERGGATEPGRATERSCATKRGEEAEHGGAAELDNSLEPISAAELDGATELGNAAEPSGSAKRGDAADLGDAAEPGGTSPLGGTAEPGGTSPLGGTAEPGGTAPMGGTAKPGGAAEGRRVVHGSTVATNAILERKGVRTAFVANQGFADLLEIGRQNRSRLYDLSYEKPAPIVPAELCFGLPGRVLSNGEERQPLDEAAVLALAERLREAGVESVALCLLFSFANPAHERRVAELLAPLGLPLSLSHEILAEFREFERASTTVLNAYVSPKMDRYLGWLEERLGPGDSLRVMQSNGGAISSTTARKESVRTILSGPAGGVVAALELGRLAGFDRLITFDMGGTSTDVSLLDGGPSLTMEASIAGFPARTPMLDIHTVGAGGGSLAGRDRGGALTVGPESAGADPGPICYGKGQGLTVTDANAWLGRLLPDHFLGGGMRLAVERVEPALLAMGRELGLSPLELAEGVTQVANANMERAIRVISVERGHDPREFSLFAFGGAGGLHAAHLARALGMPRVIAPPHPGALSALGMLLADVVKDYSLTVMLPAEPVSLAALPEAFAPLEQRALTEMADEGAEPGEILLERSLDMRYEGQSFEIVTPLDADPLAGFHALHERMYGYRHEHKPVRIVNLRLRARGRPPKPELPRIERGGPNPPQAARLGTRPVVFEGQALDTKVYRREALQAGNRLPGPALLVEYSSTILVPPFAEAMVDPFGNLILSLEENASGGQRG